MNYVLQNTTVQGKKLTFTLRKPFDLMAKVKGFPILLRAWDDVRLAIIAGKGGDFL